MIKQKSFLIDERVHSRLKDLAEEKGIPLGTMIRRLLDHYEGRVPNPASPEYRKWLCGVIRAGQLGGDEGAEAFMVGNPAPQ